jgi:hypothetical protein
MKNKNTLSKSSKRRDEKVAALNYPPVKIFLIS